MKVSQENLSVYQAFLLFFLSYTLAQFLFHDRPKTTRFFSGSFFPLATLSSSEDHMPFSSPSLLCGRPLPLVYKVLGPLELACRLMVSYSVSQIMRAFGFCTEEDRE